MSGGLKDKMKWMAWVFIGVILTIIFAGLIRWFAIMVIDLIDAIKELRDV